MVHSDPNLFCANLQSCPPEQLSDAQGSSIQVGADYVAKIFVRIVLGTAVLENQLTGLTARVLENSQAVFSGLRAPTLTGTGFQLQFVFEDAAAGVLVTAHTEEFSFRPAGLVLNNTHPHARAGMPFPALSIRLTNQAGVFTHHLVLPDPQKSVQISMDLFTTRYIGCSRHRPLDTNDTISANWTTCARRSILEGKSFFYIGLDDLEGALCGHGGVVSEGCDDDACWHNVSVSSPQCSTAGCGQVVEQEEGAICNESFGFRFFAVQNSSSMLMGTRQARAFGGLALFDDVVIPGVYGKAACMLLFSDDGDADGEISLSRPCGCVCAFRRDRHFILCTSMHNDVHVQRDGAREEWSV